MSHPRKGSTKWRGQVKHLVYTEVDKYNRLFALVGSDARLKITQKPRVRGQKKESQ